MHKQKIIWAIVFGLIIVAAFWGGYLFSQRQLKQKETSITNLEPNVGSYESAAELPLAKYAIGKMAETELTAGPIVIESVVADEEEYMSVIFSFLTPDNKKMTGLANLPKTTAGEAAGTILMLRGYVSQSGYVSGTGTKNAAIYFAKNGYQTFAPDFLGYGESEAAPEDSWEGRFEKPLQMKQLLTDLEASEFTCNQDTVALLQNQRAALTDNEKTYLQLCQDLPISVVPDKISLWAHSNGGQIALTLLEIIDRNLPTTLWAPVSVGFPYSVLFFTDEYEDEGKGMRQYIHSLEQDYDVFDYSHTQHLDKIPAGTKLQIHHGTADDAALIAWSDEFVAKITAENKQRAKDDEIEVQLYRYHDANHNLQPDWQTVVERDLEFFSDSANN